MAHTPRHGKRSAATFVLLTLTLVSIGTFGWVAAQDTARDPAGIATPASLGTLEDETMTLPATHSGDVARYGLVSDGKPITLDMALVGDVAFQDGLGTWHAAWGLQQSWDGAVATTFVDPANGVVLGSESPAGAAHYTMTYLLPTSPGEGMDVTSRMTVYGQDLRPCGVDTLRAALRMPLHGATLPGRCPKGPAEGRLVDGLLVFAIEGRDVAAFRPDSPYPAWSEGTVGERLTLEGFTAGGQPSAVALPPPSLSSPLEPIAAGRMGPSEVGSALKPTFAQLFDDARKDLVNDRLRTYLAANPGWYVAMLNGHLQRDANGTVAVYDVVLNAPRNGFRLHLQGPRDNVTGVAHSVIDKLFGWDGKRIDPWDVATPAVTLPSVGSAQALWQVEGREATWWGYDTTCGYACLEHPFLWVGNTSLVPGSSADIEGQNRTGGAFLIGPSGAVEAKLSTQETHYEFDPKSAAPLPNELRWAAPVQPMALGLVAWDGGSVAAAGLVGALFAVLYKAWPSLKAAAMTGMFSRVREDRLLEHPTRKAILQAVQAEPGIHHKAIGRKVQAGNGALEHHLRKLVDGGLLRRMEGHGYTSYFEAANPAAMRGGVNVLKAEGAKRVLRSIAKAPHGSAAAIAQLAHLDATTVTHHVRRLQEAGLVRTLRQGREMRVSLTHLGEQAAAGN